MGHRRSDQDQGFATAVKDGVASGPPYLGELA
jgi:hypothetical protein